MKKSPYNNDRPWLDAEPDNPNYVCTCDVCGEDINAGMRAIPVNVALPFTDSYVHVECWEDFGLRYVETVKG